MEKLLGFMLILGSCARIITVVPPGGYLLEDWIRYVCTCVPWTDQTGVGEAEPADPWSLHHRPGSSGEYSQQHTSEFLQQHHQLP